MASEQKTQAKALPRELTEKLRAAAGRLWQFVNSEYQERDGTRMRIQRRHSDVIHALRAIAADIAFCPYYALEEGSDQRSALEHAISLLKYAPDWQDDDRAKVVERELDGLVAEADEATGFKQSD